jgi:hypothetical protein
MYHLAEHTDEIARPFNRQKSKGYLLPLQCNILYISTMPYTIILLIIILVLFLLGRHLQIRFIYVKSLSLKGILTTVLGLILFVFLIIPYSGLSFYAYIPYPLIYSLVIWSLFSLYTYFVLYKTLSISLSFLSCMWFCVNLLIFYTYLVAFNMLLYRLKDPFYFKDLSTFAQYRYLIFVIVGFFLILLHLSNFLIPLATSRLKPFFILISFPYLYEETRKIFAIWETSFWGPFFETIIAHLNSSKCYYYLVLHTILSHISPLVFALLFAYLVFYEGDFRYIIYMIFLSIISWFYCHIAYYFFTFLNSNLLALKDLLNIHLLRKPLELTADIAQINPQDICFTLSDNALKDFGSEYNHQLLLQNWTNDFVRLSRCQSHIIIYQNKVYYMPYITLGIRYLVWVKISLFFFFPDYQFAVTTLLSKVFNPNMVFTRSYVTKAYFVKKTAQTALETLTNGAYKGPHPVTTDEALVDGQGNVPFMHQPTRKGGPNHNPSKPLSNQVDLQNDPIPQNAVYPDPKLGPLKFSQAMLDNEIKGSEAFYKRPEVIANDKANTSTNNIT